MFIEVDIASRRVLNCPLRKLKPMTDLGAVLEQLRVERANLDRAIDVLSGLVDKAGKSRRGKRRLSAAARERIAAAQRARWAKFRAKKGK